MGTHPIFESDFDCLTDLGEPTRDCSCGTGCHAVRRVENSPADNICCADWEDYKEKNCDLEELNFDSCQTATTATTTTTTTTKTTTTTTKKSVGRKVQTKKNGKKNC